MLVHHAYMCGERHSLTFAHCYPIPLPCSHQSLSLRHLELLGTVAVEINTISIIASKIDLKKNAITVHDNIISVIVVRSVKKKYLKNAITVHDNIITIIASEIGK